MVFASSSPILGIVPARSCLVSFTDTSGVHHEVKVAADSLYEAAVLGMSEFRKCRLMDVVPGPATTLTVSVKAPATEHRVAVRHVLNWLDGNTKPKREVTEGCAAGAARG